MQGRGIRSESQESCSPDSACSLGYDSRESSPDCVMDGEVFLQITTIKDIQTKKKLKLEGDNLININVCNIKALAEQVLTMPVKRTPR